MHGGETRRSVVLAVTFQPPVMMEDKKITMERGSLIISIVFQPLLELSKVNAFFLGLWNRISVESVELVMLNKLRLGIPAAQAAAQKI